MIDRVAIHQKLEARGILHAQYEVMQGHMVRLFEEVMAFTPKLIVELGVGRGCSNLALGMAAELCGAEMISVDKNQCEVYQGVEFVLANDLDYVRTWSRGPAIDILMIDTEHTYSQLQQEIRAWVPLLRPHCKLILHDTDAAAFEGVARFMRDWLGVPIPGSHFDMRSGEWNVRHYPESNGLTILDRGLSNG